MTTLSTLRKELILTNDKLINLNELLSSMENDPVLHFEDEMTAAYNDRLNEIYADQFESFPFSLGDPCDWIEENQPTDYRVGFADFEFDYSTQDLYIDTEEQIEELEVEKQNIEEEIEELENN